MKELNAKNVKQYNNKSGIYYFKVGRHSYVGSSVNVGARLRQHIWAMRNGKHRNRIVQNCYNKYSITGFTFKILEFCDPEKRIEREEYYIRLLKPNLNVCNPITLKREDERYKERQRQLKKEYYKTHESKSKIPVYQYSKSGEYISCYPSATEAAALFGVEVSAMTAATNSRSVTCCGFQWRKFKTDSIPSIIKEKTIKVKEKKPSKPGNKKRIYRYSYDGTYIDSFPSASEADRQLGIHGCASAARGDTKYKSIGGYLWSYEKKDSLPKYENHSKDAKKVSVRVIDINTQAEYVFDSIAESVRTLFPDATNFDSVCASVSCAARGKTEHYKQYKIEYIT